VLPQEKANVWLPLVCGATSLRKMCLVGEFGRAIWLSLSERFQLGPRRLKKEFISASRRSSLKRIRGPF